MEKNVGGSTPKSLTRSSPLADITNVSAADLKKKRASAMDNNVGGFTPKLSTRLGPLADITNVSAADLKKKHAKDRYALLTDDQKKDIVQRNHENRRWRNEESTSNKQIAEAVVVGNPLRAFSFLINYRHV